MSGNETNITEQEARNRVEATRRLRLAWMKFLSERAIAMKVLGRDADKLLSGWEEGGISVAFIRSVS